MHSALEVALDEALEALPQKSALILKMRFGIDVTNPMTLEEVGQCFGLTRERIRQIESKALKVLKHPVRCEVLQLFLGTPKKKETEDEIVLDDIKHEFKD